MADGSVFGTLPGVISAGVGNRHTLSVRSEVRISPLYYCVV